MKAKDIEIGKKYHVDYKSPNGGDWSGIFMVKERFSVVFHGICDDGDPGTFHAKYFVKPVEYTKKDFLNKILETCREYGYSIGHEDDHGAFQIVEYSTGHEDWLAEAKID